MPVKLQFASVTGHFVPRSVRTILVISYTLFGHFEPSNSHFVPSSFRTHFGHFVPSSTGCEMTFGSHLVPKSFRTYFGHFVPTLVISYLGSVHIKIIYLNTCFSCEHFMFICTFCIYFIEISFLLTDVSRYVTISSPGLGAKHRH